MDMKNKMISQATIRRLPRYLRMLTEMEKQGETRISSAELGKRLGMTASQIRQDLNCFGQFGQQGYGYRPGELADALRSVLGMDRAYCAILIGVGNIGKALMENFCFQAWGFRLLCAFDVDPAVTGSRRKEVPIFHTDALEDYLAAQPVDVAVLCVPGDIAGEMAHRLAACGVKAIWNFTDTEILSPYSPVLVENIHFSDSLLTLSYFLSQQPDPPPRPGR